MLSQECLNLLPPFPARRRGRRPPRWLPPRLQPNCCRSLLLHQFLQPKSHNEVLPPNLGAGRRALPCEAQSETQPVGQPAQQWSAPDCHCRASSSENTTASPPPPTTHPPTAPPPHRTREPPQLLASLEHRKRGQWRGRVAVQVHSVGCRQLGPPANPRQGSVGQSAGQKQKSEQVCASAQKLPTTFHPTPTKCPVGDATAATAAPAAPAHTHLLASTFAKRRRSVV